MHYALCIIELISLLPNMIQGKIQCKMRFMHYEAMHYELINCSIKPLGWPISQSWKLGSGEWVLASDTLLGA